MVRTSLVCVLFLMGRSTLATAASFSPEELRQLRELIRDELRTEIRQEVMSELRALGYDVRALPGASESTPSSPQTRVSVVPAQSQVSSDGLSLAGDQLIFAASAAPMGHTATEAKSGFQLTAGTDAQRASLRSAREISRKSTKGMASFDTVSLTVSAPLAKPDSGITNIATLDGFTNASELAFSYGHWTVNGLANPATSLERMATRDEICALAGVKPADPCDTSAVKEGLRTAGRMDRYSEFQSLFWDLSKLQRWTYGGSLRVGHEAFNYFLSDLTKTKDDEMSWGGKLYFGYMPKGRDVFLAMGAEWQKSYQAVPIQSACTASDATVLTCVTGSLAAPRLKVKQLLTAEARGHFGDVGIAMKVTHDLHNDESGVDLPIYLFRNTNSQFTGGFRIGWSSTDDFSFGVFVGSPLAALP